MTIGEKLKRERKKQGFDLDSVAKETKIAKMFLIAIEEDELSSLPGGVYTRNFLRAYAKYLNLDEDIITAEYHEQYDVKPHFVIHQEQTKKDDLHFKRQRWRFLMTLFFVLLIAGAVAAVAYYFPFWKTETSRFGNTGQVQTALGSDRSQRPSPTPKQMEVSTPKKQNAERSTLPEVASQDKPVATKESEDPSGGDQTQLEKEDIEPSPSAPSGAPPITPTTASVDTKAAVLPLKSMRDIREYCTTQNLDAIAIDQEDVRIENVFAIEAVEKVDIEVYVDGNMATRRQLRPGQVRFYRYGNYNRVIIGDISKVNLQDGEQFFSGTELEPEYVFLPDFGPGGFLAQLHDVLRNRTLQTP